MLFVIMLLIVILLARFFVTITNVIVLSDAQVHMKHYLPLYKKAWFFEVFKSFILRLNRKKDKILQLNLRYLQNAAMNIHFF